MHETSAVGLPVSYQISRILIGARLHSDQDAARANTLLVFLDAWGSFPTRYYPTARWTNHTKASPAMADDPHCITVRR